LIRGVINMKEKWIFLIVMAAALLSTGCSKENLTDRGLNTKAAVENVQTARVSHSSIEDFYEATGTVKAKTTTDVSSNIMGRIVTLRVAEGDRVARGQVLIEIDNSDSKAQVDKTQAALTEAEASLTEVARSVEAAKAAVRTAEVNKRFAESTFGRYRELYDRRSVSAQEFDEAKAKLDSANSELDRSRANVQTIIAKNKQINARIQQARADIAGARVQAGYTKIVSPVSGILVKKFVESGATASPGVPLLSIEDNSQYRLEANVEESRSSLVRIGNRVNVQIDAVGRGDLMGTVAEILPVSDAASRSYIVKIDLPRDPAFRSGLYGIARFPLAQKEAITVPQAAMAARGPLTGVYVVGDDRTAQFRIVTTGRSSEGMIEILSGVSEGDEIAVSNIDKLSDGSKVK
jgi:multidrug efflux pump subunit AcrA (membrane-fusion protein)